MGYTIEASHHEVAEGQHEIDFKFDEDVDACYNLITTKQVFQKDQTEIEIKHSDAMIDLSPCIGIYQQANFFDFYDIDSAIAFFMYLHKDKMAKVPTSWKSVEQKVLFLTMLMTSQDRYIKQVELPFITPEQAKALTDRLSTMFTHDEEVQERAELNIVVEQDELKQPVTSLIVSGMADVVKDNNVYYLKFVSNLAHKHFIQCACHFTDTCTTCSNQETHSKRQEIKELIRTLKQRNTDVEAHIFRSVENVNLDTVIGWKTGGKKYSFLDRYDEEA